MKADESKEIKFEVGDLVVLRPSTDADSCVFTGVYPVIKVSDQRITFVVGGTLDVVQWKVRHATDQERVAGHRIEQRPHPCASICPNFTDEQCCHCLVGGA